MSCFSAPEGYRLVRTEAMSILWFQTAGIALHYLGVGTVQTSTDDHCLACVRELGQLYTEHREILPDLADIVMDHLLQAAHDLEEISGH